MTEIESESGSESESQRITPDALAEKILREHILKLYPNIDKVEHGYWEARGRLYDMAVNELKGNTK